MVGLPCSGKSFLAKKLSEHLNDQGYLSKIFNIGDFR